MKRFKLSKRHSRAKFRAGYNHSKALNSGVFTRGGICL